MPRVAGLAPLAKWLKSRWSHCEPHNPTEAPVRHGDPRGAWPPQDGAHPSPHDEDRDRRSLEGTVSHAAEKEARSAPRSTGAQGEQPCPLLADGPEQLRQRHPDTNGPPRAPPRTPEARDRSLHLAPRRAHARGHIRPDQASNGGPHGSRHECERGHPHGLDDSHHDRPAAARPARQVGDHAGGVGRPVEPDDNSAGRRGSARAHALARRGARRGDFAARRTVSSRFTAMAEMGRSFFLFLP